jgi:hypothetical protein
MFQYQDGKECSDPALVLKQEVANSFQAVRLRNIGSKRIQWIP